MSLVSSHPHGAVPDVPADKADDFMKKYRAVVRKTWTDPAFKAAYLADPAGALRQAGIDIPPGMQVKVVEHSADEKEGESVLTLPLPSQSATGVDDEMLAAVAGGGSSSSASSASSASCPCCSAGSSGSAC